MFYDVSSYVFPQDSLSRFARAASRPPKTMQQSDGINQRRCIFTDVLRKFVSRFRGKSPSLGQSSRDRSRQEKAKRRLRRKKQQRSANENWTCRTRACQDRGSLCQGRRKKNKRKKKDAFTRNAVRVAEGVGDPTEYDQAGVDRDQITGTPSGGPSHNQVCCHPDDKFYDGRRLVAAMAVHPKQILIGPSNAPVKEMNKIPNRRVSVNVGATTIHEM